MAEMNTLYKLDMARALDLEPHNYDEIRELMLGMDTSTQVSGVTKYQSTDITNVFGCSGPWSRFAVADTSLTRQLKEVLIDNPSDTPEAFFFTARSALPIAAAIRGFTAELDIETPRLEYIGANSRNSYNHFRGSLLPHELEDQAAEIERLKMTANTVERACVVDQLVASGNCAEYAGWLLTKAGVTSVQQINGLWYDHWTPKDFSLGYQLSTEHDDFMNQIGAAAAHEITAV